MADKYTVLIRRFSEHAAFTIATVLLAFGCTSHEKVADTPREQLLARLHRIGQCHACVFGHHDDPVYGHGWKGTGISDVKAVAGDYPGLMSWDLGLIEHNAVKNLDGVPFARIRDEVLAQHERGGINTFSWHLRNPATGGDSWDTGSRDIIENCVESSSPLHDTLQSWIGRAADFIGSLRDTSGCRIPVIFRPWHEHTGDWFWWGRPYTTPEYYKELWHMTRAIFDEKGIDNVLWTYAPDAIERAEEYTECYPGDAFIDIVGADVYHFDGKAGLSDYLRRAKLQLDAAAALAARTNKPMALTETGSEGIPLSDWFTEILLPLCTHYPIVYVCVWRNAHDRPEHFYAPWPGHPAEADFRRFYAAPCIWFARDLQAGAPRCEQQRHPYEQR